MENERENFMMAMAKSLVLISVFLVHYIGTVVGSLAVMVTVVSSCMQTTSMRSLAFPLALCVAVSFGSMGHESRKSLLKFVDSKFGDKPAPPSN